MGVSTIPDQHAIDETLQVVAGLPVFIAGSSVAAVVHRDVVGEYAYSDVDVFCAGQNSLIASVQRLIDTGATVNERHERVWQRWLEHGFNQWHTNSLRLDLNGIEVNCVYKLIDGHPTTSLAQVIESFDFGFLAAGYDARDGLLRDMRSYFYPTLDVDGPLPLLPIRRSSWRNGFISQYQGLREVGRYVKYLDYGYDLSAVKDDLLTGYKQVSSYLIDRGDADKVQLGEIYQSIAMHIEDDDITALREAGAEILYLDDLDAIMEKLQ